MENKIVGELFEERNEMTRQYNAVSPLRFRNHAVEFIWVRLRTHIDVMQGELDRKDVEWSEEDIEFYKAEVAMTKKMILELGGEVE